ncbi:DivIVA domain-containing protein [Blastococcus mobilis]|uniref:Cell wall synthesis protein Wag31 n=1 Tax=Blastococcus mobilis TaxID=1938746 RepID=A0A238USD6_9ACTN|nr:DivIVA domain-containing protein [Blastococcus mobilis]SNR24587.1 DivIVA domain-containing protein [Blastococcus mobilis]
MTIAPDEIEAQQFRVMFRGYDVEQVDAFLDRMQQEFTRLLAERGSGTGPVPDGAPSAAPDAPADEAAPGPSARALRTLLRAEQMADQMIADAEAEAEEIRAQAQAERQQALAETRAECARLHADLTVQREQEIGALLVRLEQLQAEVARLDDLESRARESLRRWIDQHQRLLTEGTGNGGAVAGGSAVATPVHPPAA